MAGVVLLWSDWEVQILVLVSFTLQVFLLVFARIRRRDISVVPRTLLWLAYLLADIIALYILGHMSFCGKSREQEQTVTFWAPFLLVHLGGQDTITAYSMEDNQLWPRQLLSLLVQTVGVAYVLYKYVAGSSTLVTAAALMTVAGFLKYGERVWALKSSNLDSIRNVLDEDEKPRIKKEGEGEETYRPHAQWRGEGRLGSDEVLQGAHDLFPICMGQMVDYKFWPSRLQSEAIKLFAEKGCLYELIEMQLSLMHDVLYTKAVVIHSWCGCFIRAFSLVAIITTFFLFQSSIGKNNFNRVDAIVTYMLIAGAFVLEMIALLGTMGSTWTCALLRARRWDRIHNISLAVRGCVKAAERSRRWYGSIRQHKLLISTSGKEHEDVWQKSLGTSTAWSFGCKGLWHKLHPFLFSRSVVISTNMKELVVKEILRMVRACGEATYVRLGLSGVKDLIERIREHSRRREALLRRRKHMETLYRNQHMDGLEERSIRREELDTTNELDRRIEELYTREDLLEQDRRREDQSVVSRGAELAGRLLDMEARGEQEVRQVVLGVWVEMLCYAAHHCNRDSHASQLNSGGEFITIVWLLSAAMFNSRYCDQPWFVEHVQDFFRSPLPVQDKSGWFRGILFCCRKRERSVTV
ncbi:uncharacterized protein [Lolium perenne]|uniref:uncharacterized protein n=1 Tax=Lolium perenne TaxID=4522 RepID=UPI003A9A62AF